MALSLTSSPIKTVNGILSDVGAAKSQLPYEFLEDDLAGKNNYKVNIRIFDGTNTNELTDTVFKYSPKPDGTLFIDVGEILTNLQLANSLLYVLRYFATWEGTTQGEQSTSVVQSVLAKKQLLDRGGSNMWLNLLRTNTGSSTESKIVLLDEDGTNNIRIAVDGSSTTYAIGDIIKIKSGKYNLVTQILFIPNVNVYRTAEPFRGGETSGIIVSNYGNPLTKFVNGLVWLDWKRTTSYIIDTNYLTRTGFNSFRFSTTAMNINKNPISGINQDEDIDISQRMVQITMDNPNVDGEKYLRTWLRNNALTSQVSESAFYLIKQECDNPIMIEWRNGLGAYEQHLFILDTLFNRNVTEGVTAKKAVQQDIETVVGTEDRKPLFWFQEAILTDENLTPDVARALMEIKSSPQVRVYLTKDGSKFVGVIVNNLMASEINNNDTSIDFSLQIKFPDNFDFETAKLY